MPAFKKEEFQQVLSQVQRGEIAPVYLLHGESYLVKSALRELTGLLIPESRRGTNLEIVDGSQANFRQVLDSLNTFALFGGGKVVVVQDGRFFYSRANLPDLLVKSKEAYEAGDLQAAARLLLEVLAYSGWSLADVAGGAWREIPPHIWQQTVGTEQDEAAMAWLEAVSAHASSSGMEAPERGDDAALLEAALEKGFAPEHCLLIATDTVDKRRSVYRLIEKKGIVIDFTVASGSGRQARSEQGAVLKALARETLGAADKSIEPTALSILLERTGFNLWALKSQLEKLIAFVGEDMLVTRDHVEVMSEHFREEPLYELNSAVASRDCAASLGVLNRLLDQNYHPLQLVSSLANEFRRLLVAREFLDIHLEGGVDPSIPYGRFSKSIYPLVKARTAKESMLGTLHPFALHKTMVRSTAFEPAELISRLHQLFAADITLKSTGVPEREVMESLIFKLCESSEPRLSG